MNLAGSTYIYVIVKRNFQLETTIMPAISKHCIDGYDAINNRMIGLSSWY